MEKKTVKLSPIKHVRYMFEYLLACTLFTFFKVLPYQTASSVGGAIARLVFIHTRRTKIARNNICLAMPHLTSDDVDKIIASMWENIGRNFAEFPHISTMQDSEIMDIASISGQENIHSDQQSGRGALYFTAHLGNWEIAPRLFFALGHPVNIVYRQASNPGIENIIQKARSRYVINTLPKGPGGARGVLAQLKKGHGVGMLVDQKMNDGVKINFFGRNAMTAPAIARLALKYHYPVIPVRVTRFNNFQFKVTVYPQLELPDTNNKDNDIITLLYNINHVLEDWIKEDPGQWIWMHNRWN